MKSPLLRAFSVPDVHPRLRKRPPRCTLDCGFKTPESPALRGFEAERGRFATTSLYLVLKSNGLHRPKIRLKKFGFSSKSVPANIAKKLPPQRCFKPLFIPVFNFPHKWPTFAFTGESEYTLGFANRIAHSGPQGRTRRLHLHLRCLHLLLAELLRVDTETHAGLLLTEFLHLPHQHFLLGCVERIAPALLGAVTLAER